MPVNHQIPKKTVFISGLVLLAIAVGSFILVPQLTHFQRSWQALRSANLLLSGVALVVSLGACVVSGLLYVVLAKRRLNVANTVLVQLTGLLVNRVLPAGIGGLSLNMWYLKRSKLRFAEASVTVALNNTLGFVGHLLLLMVFIVPFSTELMAAHQTPIVSRQAVGIGLLAVGLVALAGVLLRRHVQTFWRQIKRELQRLVNRFKRRPDQLLLCIGLSCTLTLCNVVSFWLCCQAVQLHVSFVSAFFVYSFSVLLGTATPTPGGLGGVEAALLAGLLSRAIPAPQALAATLLYRLVSYWFGLVIGAAAGVVLRLRLA